MSKKIVDLKIEEVSVVDAGANQDAHIKLWKRAETVTTGNVTEVQNVELKKEPPVAEAEKQVEEQPVETLTTDLDSVRKQRDQLEKELEKVRKELSTELEIRTKELKDSREETEKVRKQRRRERFIKRAEELSYLPGTRADDFAEILDTIASAIPEKMFTKFNNLLTSWNAVVEKNDVLFREVGVEGQGLAMLSGPQAQIEALALEKMAADPKLTKAQAISRVTAERPDIYRKYQQEQGGK